MKHEITGTELEIMQYLWEQNREYTFAELLDYFNSVKRKDWCKQTLNTCLLRLKKRGLLSQKKRGTKSVYFPSVTKIQYDKICAEEILDKSYNGNLISFLSALTGGEKLSEADKEELLDFIHGFEEE